MLRLCLSELKNYSSGERAATDDDRRMRLLRRWQTSSSWLDTVFCSDIACRQLRRIFMSPATLSFSTYESHSWLARQNTPVVKFNCMENKAQSLRHRNFATVRHQVMRFSAECSKRNCLHAKASVWIQQLNILCLAACFAWKHFLSKHFAEKCTTLWFRVSKLWCRKLCAIFSGTSCIFHAQTLHHNT